MIDSYFRTPYQTFLVDPIVSKLTNFKLSPLTYTWAAMLSGITIPLLLYFEQKTPALFVLLLSGYLDTIDGSIARALKKESSKGAVLDIISDRVVEASCVFGLYLVDPASRATLSMLMLISILICVTSFLVVGIFTENDSMKSFHYSPGLMERAEAFIFFGAMMIFPTYFFALSSLFTFFVFFTAFVRIYQFFGKR